jgi:hypothetical protein
MRKLLTLAAATMFLFAMTGTANAYTVDYHQTFTGVTSPTAPYGDTITVQVTTPDSPIDVNAQWTKTVKRRCTATPGVTIVNVDGVFSNGSKVLTASGSPTNFVQVLQPGAYKITPFWYCTGKYTTTVTVWTP